MANRYFAGNSLAAFTRTSTTIIEDTTAGRYDSTYVSAALLVPAGAADYAETWAFSATGTVYARFDMFYSGGVVSGTGFTLMNGSTGVFRLTGTGTNCQAQYWNGSAWTNTGSTFNITINARQTIMVKVVLGSSFEVYVNGTLAASGSGWSGGGTTVTTARLYSISTNGIGVAYSQVMIADYDIRDAHANDAAINGNSATNTGGTGTYTDVNEAQLDESTAETVATVGNKMGQTHASITLATGNYIAAMVVNVRGRVSGGTVTDGKIGVRSGGTNSSSSGRSFTGGYEPRGYILETDPATSTGFDQTSFNNAETYIEAA
jgi:hypothetical protein